MGEPGSSNGVKGLLFQKNLAQLEDVYKYTETESFFLENTFGCRRFWGPGLQSV